MLQFDIVLQKINLQRSHQTMHMPTHGEYLVETLCQMGLNSGFIWGYEDFFSHAKILSKSPADILIICGLDQHYTEDFLLQWPAIQTPHTYRVLVSSEPIYSPLAYYVDDYNCAPFFHEQFLHAFQPHAVLYPSFYDCGQARQKFRHSFIPVFYPLSDPDLLQEAIIPWEQKRRALLFLGKPDADAWKHSQVAEWGWNRYLQLQYFANQPHFPCATFHESFTFRECYQVANRYRYQLQLRSGYAFHTARILQAAMVQSIPIILLPREVEWLLAEEGPWLIPDHNVLVGWDGEYADLWDKLTDDPWCRQLLPNLPALSEQIRARRAIEELAGHIHGFFQ